MKFLLSVNLPPSLVGYLQPPALPVELPTAEAEAEAAEEAPWQKDTVLPLSLRPSLAWRLRGALLL
jgi:hypothetical protein